MVWRNTEYVERPIVAILVLGCTRYRPDPAWCREGQFAEKFSKSSLERQLDRSQVCETSPGLHEGRHISGPYASGASGDWRATRWSASQCLISIVSRHVNTVNCHPTPTSSAKCNAQGSSLPFNMGLRARSQLPKLQELVRGAQSPRLW